MWKKNKNAAKVELNHWLSMALRIWSPHSDPSKIITASHQKYAQSAYKPKILANIHLWVQTIFVILKQCYHILYRNYDFQKVTYYKKFEERISLSTSIILKLFLQAWSIVWNVELICGRFVVGECEVWNPQTNVYVKTFLNPVPLKFLDLQYFANTSCN